MISGLLVYLNPFRRIVTNSLMMARVFHKEHNEILDIIEGYLKNHSHDNDFFPVVLPYIHNVQKNMLIYEADIEGMRKVAKCISGCCKAKMEMEKCFSETENSLSRQRKEFQRLIEGGISEAYAYLQRGYSFNIEDIASIDYPFLIKEE